VEAAHPHLNLTLIWRNLQTTWITEVLSSEWYAVIHDLLPTNDRIHRIALTETDQCQTCGQKDTTDHRIFEYGEGRMLWRWTRASLAMILRTSEDHIPNEWPLRPSFQIWPPQRHEAILWLLAHFVHFLVQYSTPIIPLDYTDFRRQTRCRCIISHNDKSGLENT
jgi:hypothetical protein